MKTLEEALRIIDGSKQFSFEYGDNGNTVLVITGYRTGETLRLDLAYLTQDMLDELQVEPDTEDAEDGYDAWQ